LFPLSVLRRWRRSLFALVFWRGEMFDELVGRLGDRGDDDCQDDHQKSDEDVKKQPGSSAAMLARYNGLAMEFRIIQERASDLAAYGTVPIGFQVERIMDVNADGLVERTAAEPFFKDYDAIPGNAPADWVAQFDCSEWGILAAFSANVRIGGAIVRPEVLWDLRVHPRHRGQGVGGALFEAAVAWGRAKGYRHLVAETQDVNVAACRFYAKQGCRLGAVNRRAYADFPGETQLLWIRDLAVI
jgi:GNAT superfamily N-acetyltransferase